MEIEWDKETKMDFKFLNEQEFYDLMQRYRHAPLSDQKLTTEAFENVKNYVERNIQKQLAELRLET